MAERSNVFTKAKVMYFRHLQIQLILKTEITFQDQSSL